MDQLVILSKLEQEYLLHTIESSLQIRMPSQLFLWAQGQLQALLPHQVLVCMQFDQAHALVRLECLHGNVMDADTLAALCDSQRGLAVQAARHCSVSGSLPSMMDTAASVPPALLQFQVRLRASGHANLLLHGSGMVAGGATVFALFGLPLRPGPRQAYFLALLLPHLHLALLRLERRAEAPRRSPRTGAARTLSPREAEIMHWLREGRTNAEIAAILGLSPLTVKNHLQRMYRLLGVGNRTEAVARSLTPAYLISPA
ncbi:MAG: XrtB/PEP-CTERM-associated transcriptional regulator EpsA [Pseudomonadota bacterium]